MLHEQLALQVERERPQVGLWRAAFDRLLLLECLAEPPALRQAIRDLLADAARPSAPGPFTAEQWAQLFAVACEPPEQSGRPLSHWTQAELAAAISPRGIVSSISVRPLGRVRKEAALKPHRSRSWLQAQEKDAPPFVPQSQTVCATEAAAPPLYPQSHTPTISTDERTGIQAWERLAETQPTKPGQEACREFEYQRPGTPAVSANFHVVTGKLVSPTVQDTRTEVDCVKHLERTSATAPQAHGVIVTDPWNSHLSEGLVRRVAHQGDSAEETLGQQGQRGVLKSVASRKKFWTDLQQRSRLVSTPKHSSWLNQVEMWFSILVRRVIRRGSVKSKADLRTKSLDFSAYFNKVLAKPFKWTFTGQVLKT